MHVIAKSNVVLGTCSKLLLNFSRQRASISSFAKNRIRKSVSIGITSTLLGAAGEHHVMTELLRRDFIAALAPHGVPNVDIVVTDIEGTRAIPSRNGGSALQGGLAFAEIATCADRNAGGR